MALESPVDILKALADPTRLRLLALLREHGTLCVCELEEVLELPQYTVSRHLGVLRRAGLAESARDGARVDYRLRPDLTAELLAVIDSVVGLVADEEVCVSDRRAARDVRPTTCQVRL